MENGNEIVQLDWLNDENKKIIREQHFPPNATRADMVYCMRVAEAFNLNPILKQIFFVSRKSNVNGQWHEKIEPMAGRDSFLILARRTGQLQHIKSWTEIKETPQRVNGEWVLKPDLVGIAEVKRIDTQEVFRIEVPYSEYCQKTREGKPNKFWDEKPQTMIKKVAESQVLRQAFDVCKGLYDENEVNERFVEVKKEEPKGLALKKEEEEQESIPHFDFESTELEGEKTE